MRTICKILLGFWMAALPLGSGLYGRSAGMPLQIERIFYLMHIGQTREAIEIYQKWSQESGEHNTDALQHIGLAILDQGMRTRTPEVQLLTLFGAGIAMNDQALYILEQGISSPFPQMQLTAINLLVRYQNDEADELIVKAMSSAHPLVRLEAAHQLALKKNPRALAHIESMMSKLDEEVMPIFPRFFAVLGDQESIKILKKLINHPSEDVRIEVILSAAKYNRDDLLPKIRSMATQPSIRQREACAAALACMKDESSASKLLELANDRSPAVKLAALLGLHKLGRQEAAVAIQAMAKTENLFAAYALGDIPGSEPVLRELASKGSLQVRLNAALALLELRDPSCLRALREILIKDSRDLAFAKSSSQGGSLSCWKAVPSARQNFKDSGMSLELSLHFRELVLTAALDLPEEHFLWLAELVFQTQQNDLVPTLVQLLENLQTPAAIALLQKYHQKEGAPLIRNYCNLALYRLKQDGPYEKYLQEWLSAKMDGDLIQLRPVVPWEMREDDLQYQITPHETSRLMIEAFEAFAQSQDKTGIDILLTAIKKGNEKNKFALAGLLMRTSI